MGLSKFVLELGTGIALVVIATLSFGLGVYHNSFGLLTFGFLSMVSGIIAAIVSSRELHNPDFLKAMIVRAFNRGSWTNTLCPICGWWMRSRDVKFPRESEQLVRAWYCVNPDHAKTWPEGT